MDEKKVTSAPEQSGDRDQALFASIQREKQRKKRRRIIVTVSIVVVLALAIFFGVRAAKKKVREAVGSMKAPTDPRQSGRDREEGRRARHGGALLRYGRDEYCAGGAQ